MSEPHEQRTLPTLITGSDGLTVWSEQTWPTEVRGGMVLTPRIGCASLRLRRSEPGYTAGWHVAGDPTLIVIQGGVLRIALRDGSERGFKAGEAFIAADALKEGEVFDPAMHGHRAEVAGDQPLRAIHIKLS